MVVRRSKVPDEGGTGEDRIRFFSTILSRFERTPLLKALDEVFLKTRR